MDSTFSDDSIVTVENSETEVCYPSKSGTLRIAHLNCLSLLSHINDVVTMFIAAQLDVLALTETWLDETVVDSEILPSGSGLSLLWMDRNRRGGGVAFMISAMVSFIVRFDLREGNVESLWIELFPHSKRSLLVCCAYCPPSKADFYDYFASECERSLLSASQKVLIVGDLNSDLLHPTLPQSRRLQDFMSDFHLSDMFSGPTRITESSSSHLDVFLTSTSCSFSNVAGFPSSFSDHHLVLGDYFGRRSHAPLCDHKVIYTRYYRKLDAAVLEDMLAS